MHLKEAATRSSNAQLMLVADRLSVAGRVLIEKSVDPFAAVCMVQIDYKMLAFAGQLLIQCVGRSFVDQLLDAGDDIRRASVEFFCQLHGFCKSAAGYSHAVDESKIMKSLCVDAFCAKQKLARKSPR